MDLSLLNRLLLLAEDAPAAQPNQPSSLVVFLPFLAIGVLFYFLMIRPQRREQRTRQSMLEAIKKNDRVVTIGGIYGVVTNVHKEADEITIKVDESTNTKLRMTVGSISRVVIDEADQAKGA